MRSAMERLMAHNQYEVNPWDAVMAKAAERHHYESHSWNPAADDLECVVCGVTWSNCFGTCPEEN